SKLCELWDHHFELPYKHLETHRVILDNLAVGTARHKQNLQANHKLHLYDYPGEYAQRFDGVDQGGGERPAELQKVFEDNKRTVGIRMQQEAAPGILIHGTSTCRQFTAGYKFTLTRHFDADGPYLLTQVEHSATSPVDYRSGQSGEYR